MRAEDIHRAEGDQLASRLAAIVQSSADAIIGVTLDGVITSWNTGAQDVYGYTAEEMIGRHASVLLLPDHLRELTSILDRARRGERVRHFETRRVRKDGTTIDVSMSVSPIMDASGRITGAANVTRDITERNRAVRSESELTSRLAAIVQSSTDAIIGKTLDGVITSWNAGAQDIYGYTAEEMIGRNISELVPPDRADELAEILARVRRGERVSHFETKRIRKDGTIGDVSVSISPILGDDGTITGAAAVARDITEHNRADAQIRTFQDHIHRAGRLETVGQLAGAVAHDFNNLLGAIIGLADLVTQETADEAAVKRDAREIFAAAQRAAQLTRQLLALSRRAPAEPETVNLNTVITDIRPLLTAGLGGAIAMRLDLAAGLPDIYADPGRLGQILLNLSVNARDAMPQGGTLTIATTSRYLSDQAAGRLGQHIRPGQYVEVTVTDTGTGMSPEVVSRIFEPFFTTKEIDRGTGLGLSTVYGIVAQAGGAITVDSQPGAGTVFRVFIPAVGTAVRDEPTPVASAAPAVAGAIGETILVADDQPALLHAASRILRLSGYTTLEAGSGPEALALLMSHDVQLLLTDSLMPGMSGTDLAENAEHLKPGLPVLHMSGYIPADADQQQSFVQKPFTAEILLAKVHAMLGR